MYIKKFSITFLAGIILLSGCSKQEISSNISSDLESSSRITDTMKEPVNSDGEKIPSMSYGVNFTDENMSISNSEPVVSPKLMGGESNTHVGIEEHSSEVSAPQNSDTVPLDISTGKTAAFSERMETRFVIGDNVYAYEFSQKALHKLDPEGSIIKTREVAAEVRAHGDTISLVSFNTSAMLDDGAAIVAVENPSVTLTLLDGNLDEIKSLEITENIGSEYDFDENRIACICDGEKNRDELRVFDWEQKNMKTLMTLSDRNDGRFNSISIADGYVAFIATDKHGHYYGVCDFNGKSELYSKKGISNDIQVNGGTALWSDMHVNVVGGEIPSGEIIMYTDGEFKIVKPENPIESQDVFLTGENEFITALSDGEILRQYKNGIKIAEFPLDNGEYATAAVSTGNKIFASILSGSQYKLKIWELN